MDIVRPAVAELMADVSAALAQRVSVLREDVYEVILREIPQLNGDKPVLTLLASSVHGNVDTCLQVMQHRIELSNVHAPAAAMEYAFGDPVKGTAGFLGSHQQAIAAQAVALAAEPPGPRVTTFSEVAPVALMLESGELLRGWLQATLADLATDDEHHARLWDTLRVFLRCGGSYKTTAEQLMIHKNTVQYRVRKAQESLGRPLDENRLGVETGPARQSRSSRPPRSARRLEPGCWPWPRWRPP